ncbi:MAG: WD40 repeat domain-containing protein, partial [Planctomycetes bacterium]|nr:WD40 repeat domain-containing protein [Planctomycetota bacterium]
LKALNKDRQRRYQSADALGEDISRYLKGEPIDAKRDSTWYVLTKTLHRYRAIVAVAAALVILVTGFAITMSVLAGKLADQRDTVQAARRKADKTARIRTIEAGRQYAVAGDVARAEDLIWPIHLSASAEGVGSDVDGVEPGGALDSYWALWEIYSHHPCLATWRAHDGRRLFSISFSPTGDMLATSGADGRIKLWSMPDRKNVRSFEAGGDFPQPVCFSPDGALLAWANLDGRIRLLDIEKDGFRDINAHEERVHSIAFSPDGRTLVYGGSVDGAIRQWDVQTWHRLPLIGKHKGGVQELSFSPDGVRLASSGPMGSFMVWDVRAGKLEWNSPGIRDPDIVAPRNSLCFAPNGVTLATSVEGGYTIWDLVAQKARAGGTLRDDICALRFSPDGRWLALAGWDRSITLWDVDRKRVARALAGHRGPVLGLAVDPNGQVIASCSSDGSAKLWQFSVRGDFRQLKVQSGSVHCVQFSPDGRLLASSGDRRHPTETRKSRPVRVWGASSGELLEELPGHTDVVAAVAFHPSGRRLASASHDRTVRVWDLVTSSEVSSWVAHDGKISSVVYSADGRFLATAGDDLTVKLWDGATLKLLHVFSGYSERIPMVRFSPDGRLLASCSINGDIYLHEVPSGTIHRLLKADPQGVRALCFSPDGRTLVSGNDGGAITLWDVSSGLRERSWVADYDDIYSLSFHPQGRILASGGRGREIKLWDIATGRRLATLEGHENMVLSVCFHPDGRTLASGSADGSVGLWDLTYYDRHIAGNLEYQIERLPAEERHGATIEGLRRWASRVLARPWPRELWKESAQSIAPGAAATP